MNIEGGGSGTPDTTVEPSGGVMGLIQNTYEGRCPLDNPSEIVMKALVLLGMVRHRYDGCSAQV